MQFENILKFIGLCPLELAQLLRPQNRLFEHVMRKHCSYHASSKDGGHNLTRFRSPEPGLCWANSETALNCNLMILS